MPQREMLEGAGTLAAELERQAQPGGGVDRVLGAGAGGVGVRYHHEYET